MKALMVAVVACSLLASGSHAGARNVVFFEEQFNGAALDPSVWRTEILTSGVRWCDANSGAWQGPGQWIEEGSPCHGVAAYSPYGTAILSEGMVHLATTTGQACSYLVSRLPGPTPAFPASGDFTLRVRLRFDEITLWGAHLVTLDTPSTEPVGSSAVGQTDDVLLEISGDGSAGFILCSALDGSFGPVAYVPSASELHEFDLDCAGTSFTIRADGQVVYGPVTSTLRPTAVFMGSPVLAYWYPTDYGCLSVDNIRVEVPDPVPVEKGTWGSIKALYRGASCASP